MINTPTSEDRRRWLWSYRLLRASGDTPQQAADRIAENAAARIADKLVLLGGIPDVEARCAYAAADDYRSQVYRRASARRYWATGRAAAAPAGPGDALSWLCDSTMHTRGVTWHCNQADGHTGVHAYRNAAGFVHERWPNYEALGLV